MNTVELQGKILQIYNGKNVSIVTLSVRGSKKPNYPHIFFTKRDKAVLFDFQEGDYVNIRGAIKTRRLEDDDQKTYFEQHIRGLSIEKIKTEMEEKFGADMDGKGYHEYKNEVLVKGTVDNVNFRNGVANLLIRPEGEKFHIWVSSFAPDKETLAEIYPAGSTIYAVCRVQTTRRTRRKKVRYFENIIIVEHHKAEDEPAA